MIAVGAPPVAFTPLMTPNPTLYPPPLHRSFLQRLAMVGIAPGVPVAFSPTPIPYSLLYPSTWNLAYLQRLILAALGPDPVPFPPLAKPLPIFYRPSFYQTPRLAPIIDQGNVATPPPPVITTPSTGGVIYIQVGGKKVRVAPESRGEYKPSPLNLDWREIRYRETLAALLAAGIITEEEFAMLEAAE